MSTWKQLKTAAKNLRGQADSLEKAAAEVDTAIKTAAADARKGESEGHTKTAAEKVRIGQLAKVASSKLLETGLVSDQRQADLFANQLLDHGAAIEKLAHLTQFVTAPKIGSAVVDDVNPELETADATYEKHAAAALQRLNLF